MLVLAAVASANSPRTLVHRYPAFEAGRLAPKLNVYQRVDGQCFSRSARDDARNAWRCTSGPSIDDPCFSDTTSSSFVVCPMTPWSRRVLLIRLTRPLPRWDKAKGEPLRFPWGIVTTTGKRCVSVHPGVADVAGIAMTYVCDGGGLLGRVPVRRTLLWTIGYATSEHAKRMTTVGISEAWF